MGPRIFISYSTKSAEEIRFRKALAEALTPDFRVLIDTELKDDADDWRQVINGWLGHCDAAVLVLSKSALKSAYVAYEVDVLTYRWRMDKERFKLLVVYRDGLRPEDLDKTRLRPARADDIQAVLAHEPDDVAIGRVVDLLKTHVTTPTLLDLRRGRLADLLHDVKQGDVVRLAKKIAGPADEWIKTWIPGERLADRVAVALCGVSIGKATTGLFDIRTPLGGRTNTVKALDYAASGWVDCRTVMVLAERAGEWSGNRDLAIEAASPHTVRLYISSACDCDEADVWRCATVTLATVHDRGSLASTVEAAIAQACGRESDASHEDVVAYTRDLRENGEQPVFAAITEGLTGLAFMKDLRELFPDVTFILLFGEGEIDDARLASEGIDVLRPTPGIERERTFIETYIKKRKWLSDPSHYRSAKES